jgi:hypothetical protein
MPRLSGGGSNHVRAWLANAENVDPNEDEAASQPSSESRATDCSLPSTLANSVESAAHLTQRRQAPGGRSHSVSSVSSGTKRCLEEIETRLEEEQASRRRIEEEFEARVEARVEAVRKEYAKKLKDEARRRELAETRYNKRFREMTMWRVKAHRALSALREMWVRLKDGISARAGRVQVQTGGRRRAIQTQVVMEAGSLQPRRSGVGGTEFTTRERLLAYAEDVSMGLASRHARADKSNADRVRRQEEVFVVMHPRAGCSSRRHDPDEPVDVFVTPGETAMSETRLAMHLLACREWSTISMLIFEHRDGISHLPNAVVVLAHKSKQVE